MKTFSGIPKTFQATKVSFPQSPLPPTLASRGAFLLMLLISLNMSATCCFHVILHCQAQLCVASGCERVCVCARTARRYIYVIVCVCVSGLVWQCLCSSVALQMQDDFPACDFYICISSTLMTIYHSFNNRQEEQQQQARTGTTTSHFAIIGYMRKVSASSRLLLRQPQLCLPQKFLKLLACCSASSACCCCFFTKIEKATIKNFFECFFFLVEQILQIAAAGTSCHKVFN